jgi:hypothetical protein
LFSRLQAEIGRLDVNFSKKIVDGNNQKNSSLSNYQQYRVTQGYITNLEASLRKVEQLFADKFATKANTLGIA